MEIPFVGGAYKGRQFTLNNQECQNLYPIIDNTGAKATVALQGTPGLEYWITPGSALEVRGLHPMGNYLYAIVGSSAYKISTAGAVTNITGALLTSAGPVWMEDNGTQVMIVDGTYGYTITGTTLTQVTDADFPTPSSRTYQDGYFIVTSDATGRFYISTSYDGTAWDALEYATAESYPDNLMCAKSSRRELWLIGKDSYEVWYNSGNADFPFARIEGTVNTIGCCAVHSVAEHDGIVGWLDDNRVARISNGYIAQRVSTDQVEYNFGSYTTVSDAIGYFYQQEGHIFYVLTFPNDLKTWCYDVTTQLWHTRASGTNDTRHPVQSYAFFNGMHIAGHYSNGKLYKYNLSKYSDDGTQIRRIRQAQVIHNNEKMIFHNRLQIDFEAGVGLALDDPLIALGKDPQAMLEWSNDGGRTWSNEHWTDIGEVGLYKTRAVWRRLGAARNRVYKVTIADPVKIVILGATLEASPGVT